MNEIDVLEWDRGVRNGGLMEMHCRTLAKDNAIAQVSELEETVQPGSASNGDRDLMFKARHVQMMALGSSTP